MEGAMIELNLLARLGHLRHVTLFGVAINQKHMAVWLYENVWAYHDLRWIVELGTGNGALTLHWAMCAAMRGVPFASFDTQMPEIPKVASLVRALQGKIIQADVFSQSGMDQVKAGMLANEPGLLFCDNGDKPREIETFAPMAAVGTIILAHDFPKEWDKITYPGLEVFEPWHSQAQLHFLRVAVFRRV